ncbi:MAG: VanW family protein [Chloroflexi bacterium]|nr:VanW family protein [Chloroflexota bacterium]
MHHSATPTRTVRNGEVHPPHLRAQRRQPRRRSTHVQRRSFRWALPLALGGLAALALIFELAYWERVAPGVRALNVDVGGLTRQAVAGRLRPLAAEALDRPITLAAERWERAATPRELGLRMDADELASAAFAIGRSGNPLLRPVDQVRALLFGRSVGALGEYDRGSMEAYLGRVAAEVNRPPQDAALALGADSRPRFSPARSGLEVDVQASARAISQALAQRQERAELVARTLEPSVNDQQLQPARRELEAMLAGPLVLSFQEQQWRLELAELARLLSLEVQPGVPARVWLDEAALRKRIEQIAGELKREPRNARFDWTRSGLKVIRESQDGRDLDAAQATRVIVDTLRAGERRVVLPVRVTPPAVASAEAERLGIRELIDQGQTSYAGSIEEKKYNIQLAAERLNGVVVPPGQLFSFNREVGPTTLEAGFKWGYGITTSGKEVKTVPSVAGGICQVATTLFQPVFWSGYQLEERHWHLYWIPAYTSRNVVGLDVTVDEEAQLDFQFINPTPHYLLIQAWTANDELHFALYGQKPAWKVEVDPPVVTNRVPPEEEMVFEAAPTLAWGRRLQVESAREGFDVVVVRRVISPDGEARTLRLKSSYSPSHNVTLVGTKGAPADGDVRALLDQLRAAQSALNKPVRGEGQPASDESAAAPTPGPTPSPLTTTPSPRVVPSATPSPRAVPSATPQATARPTSPATPIPTATRRAP